MNTSQLRRSKIPGSAVRVTAAVANTDGAVDLRSPSGARLIPGPGRRGGGDGGL